MIDLVVVATMGQRDLQVLAVKEGRVFSVSPAADSVRTFHQWLLDNEGGFDVVASDEMSVDVEERYRFAWRAGLPDFSEPGLAVALDSDVGRPASAGRAARLLIVPRLLGPSLALLKRELNAKTVRLHRFLVLYTHRAERSRRAGAEPIAAKVLSDWLKRWLSMVSPDAFVPPVPFLRDDEDLYVEDEAGNQHLLPLAAQRIELEMRKAAQAGAQFEDAIVRLHDSGGIPQVSPVLQACARLWFPNRVQYKAPAERGGAGEPVRAGTRVFPPVALIEARRRACDLIARGQFSAARALAEEFAPTDGNPDLPWAVAMDAVASYFEGRFQRARQQAAKIKWMGALAHLKSLLHDRWPEALHLALATEAALRSGDLPRAASLSLTFFENAVFDAVDETLARPPHTACVNWSTTQVNLHDSRLSPKERERLAREMEASPKLCGLAKPFYRGEFDRLPDLKTLRPTKLSYRMFLICAVEDPRLGNRPALAAALKAFAAAMYDGDPSPADFRNVLTHSSVAERDLNAAPQLFCQRGLWADDGGLAFLAAPRPQAVLQELGADQAQELYEGLTQGLIDDIRNAGSE